MQSERQLGGFMNLLETIEKRRSIRNFKTNDLSKEIVEDILNCGRLAPSAKNRQPWYFVIVKDKTKSEIADLMTNYTKDIDDKEERIKLGCKSSVNPTANIIKQAPILILVFREKNDNWIIGDNLSLGACIENICLRATDLGIGSLWIRDIIYVSNDVAKLVGHEEMELNCAISLGYANESPKPRPRKKLEEIIEWY